MAARELENVSTYPQPRIRIQAISYFNVAMNRIEQKGGYESRAGS